MAGKTGLRAVQPGETAAQTRRRPKSVTTAARSGSHRELLVAMRERIATTVSDPGCPPRDLAALTRRLQDIAKEIESIDSRGDDGERAQLLESALREIAPDHPLLNDAVDDAFDASVI
ncbi:hypothetical protein KXD98_08025 [Mycobacterium sp. SMC-4]|nr:hypothetical protein KXD98_08025 [Mycobacterium sp. SMC-4]